MSSITLPVSFQCSFGPDDTLRGRLTGDDAGAPGTTLEVLSQNQDIWPLFSGSFTTTTTLPSTSHPLLLDGSSYWIVTELTPFAAQDELVDYRWFLNNSGTTIPFRQQSFVGGLPSDPWTGSSGFLNLAFRVEADGPNPVPDPPTAWMLVLGMLGIAFVARKKSQ